MKSFSASVLDLKRDEGYLIAGGGLTRREPAEGMFSREPDSGHSRSGCGSSKLVQRAWAGQWELDIVVIVKISR